MSTMPIEQRPDKFGRFPGEQQRYPVDMSNQNYSPWPQQQPQKPKGGGLFGGSKLGTKDIIGMILGTLGDGIAMHNGQRPTIAPMMMKRFQDQREQAARQEEEERARQAAIDYGYSDTEANAMKFGVPLRKEPEVDAFQRTLMGAGIDPKGPQGQQLYQRRVESMTRDPNDEFVVVPLPNGTYAGPRSGLPQAMGANNSEPPERLPSDFFGQGGATGNRGGSFPRR